jgi:hypothetical protein
MTRMQQHVDRSKQNLNSLFEEVISSVEKDCTFKPSLEPTRAVNEALLQKRASSLGFEGSVEQVVLCFSSLCEWTCDFNAITGSSAAGLQAVVHDAAGGAPALPPPPRAAPAAAASHSVLQPKSPSFVAKPQFKAKKAGVAPRTPTAPPAHNDARQRPATSATHVRPPPALLRLTHLPRDMT